MFTVQSVQVSCTFSFSVLRYGATELKGCAGFVKLLRLLSDNKETILNVAQGSAHGFGAILIVF